MPIPTTFSDLSTTAASNSPAGSDNVFPDNDNYIRSHAALLASIYANSGNGWTSPYGVLATANTWTGAQTAYSFIPTSATVPANGLYLSAANTVAVASNTTLRWSVNSTGNHVFAAPISGIGATFNGVAGASVASFGANSVTVSVAYESASAMYAGTTTSNSYGLMTNTTPRLTIGPSGNFTFSAPSVGYTINMPSKTPSSASDTGVQGDISWDASYIYVCTAANTWKRVAISTW